MTSLRLWRAAASVLVRLLVFLLVIVLVWIAYVYLFAYHPDFLGWCYTQLRPVTIAMFQLIDVWLPETVKYKVSAGLTDELGPRALFLLVLGGVGEVVVFSIYWVAVSLVKLALRRSTTAI